MTKSTPAVKKQCEPAFASISGKVALVALVACAAAPAVQAAYPQGLVITTSALAINPTGTLDLKTNALVVRNGNIATITGYATTGINTALGWWDGFGINSSVAALELTNFSLGVGTMLNDFEGSPFYTDFGGVAVGVTDVLATYTWMGDADNDGLVTSSDQFFLDNGIQLNLTGWQNGDFDLDGLLTAADQFYIDNAIALGGDTSYPDPFVGPAPAPGGAVASVAAVPEPGSICLLAAGVLGVSFGRRRPKSVTVA